MSKSMDQISGCQTSENSVLSSEMINSVFEQYPYLRQLCNSILQDILNNHQRPSELSPESTQHTQHNDECSKKLDSIIESQVEIFQLFKQNLCERNEQNENLVTMKNYWEEKWRQTNAAYEDLHSTVMHIKNTNENKLNAILKKFEGFIQDDVPKLKQILDENRMFHEEANKSSRTTACSDSKAEPNLTIKKNETRFNLLSDSKGSSSYATNTEAKQKINNSKECRKHPKGVYKKKCDRMVAPHSVVSTSKECLEQQNEGLRGKEQHSEKNAPISTTALDVYKSDDDCMIIEEVPKNPQFNCQRNILIVQENANTQGKRRVADPKKKITKNNYKSHSQPFASVSLATSSKKPSVLQSGNKKRGLKKNILTTRVANHGHMVFTSNERNVPMSKETVGSMQEKLQEVSPTVQSIYSEQPNISYGEAISSAVTSSSGAQRPAALQNQHRKGKKRYSKENSLNTPPESAISSKVSIQMSIENMSNSPSISPTSGGKRPRYFPTIDPTKRIKTRKSIYELLK